MQPTLGYHSKGAAIEALRKEGKTHGEIGRLLGMKPRAVSSLLCKTRQRAERSARMVTLEVNTYHDLEAEARRRRLTPDELLKLLLDTVIADRLYSAVLDS